MFSDRLLGEGRDGAVPRLAFFPAARLGFFLVGSNALVNGKVSKFCADDAEEAQFRKRRATAPAAAALITGSTHL